MMEGESRSERLPGESLQRSPDRLTQRPGRAGGRTGRTVGVNKEDLDMQIKEKKRLQEAAKAEQNAFDAGRLHNDRLACLLHSRQEKEKRAVEKAMVDYRHHCQQQHGLNEPDPCRMTDTGDAQMMLQGLIGEDPGSRSRQQRQKEQQGQWLMQQQSERAAERRRQKMEEQLYEQSRVDMDNKVLQLQNIDMERRKAAAVATKEFNRAKIEERRRQEGKPKDVDSGVDTVNPSSMMGAPGLGPSSDVRPPPQSLHQIIQFQKHQIEEKKRMEMEKKKEEEQHDRVRVDSARAALLLERQQARLNKQLRRYLDNTNLQLAHTQRQQKPDIERGHIDDSFFSRFNSSSR